MHTASKIAISVQQSNFRHLYADMFWFGVTAGSGLSFLAIYASRLGASSMQVGLLTAGPAVGNLLISLPVGRWLNDKHLVRYSFVSSLYQRLAYVLFVLLPWLFTDRIEVWAIVLLSFVTSIPGTVLTIAFNALLAELVEPNRRGEVIGRRNALMAVSMTTALLISGQLLEWIDFPLNYQVVFLIGTVGALLSSYHVSQLRLPCADGNPARAGSEPLLRLDLLRSKFGSFMLAYLAFYLFQYLPIPLFPLFLVRELNLSDADYGLGLAVFYIVMVFFSLRLNWFSDRFGQRWMLIGGGFLMVSYPLLIGLARDTRLYWAASLAGGAVWALTGGGLLNRLMERVPEDDRPAHMTLHNLIFNLGILGGSLIGPILGDWMGLRPAILLSAGLRLVGACLLLIWG